MNSHFPFKNVQHCPPLSPRFVSQGGCASPSLSCVFSRRSSPTECTVETGAGASLVSPFILLSVWKELLFAFRPRSVKHLVACTPNATLCSASECGVLHSTSIWQFQCMFTIHGHSSESQQYFEKHHFKVVNTAVTPWGSRWIFFYYCLIAFAWWSHWFHIPTQHNIFLDLC